MARLFYKIMKPVIQRKAFSFLHEKNLQRKIDSLITMKLLANCTIGQKIGATARCYLADLPFTGYARAY